MNPYQQLYEELLNDIRNKLLQARSLNGESRQELYREVESILNREKDNIPGIYNDGF